MAFIAVSAAFAQTGAPNRERIARELQLSPDQEKQFFALQSKHQEQLKALRENQTLNPEQRREEARKIMEAQRKDMEKVLSKEQMDKLIALRQERRTAPGQRPPQPGMRGRNQPPAPVQRAGNDQLARELRAYSEKEIMPQLRKERARLEKKISRKDSEILASIRTQLKAMGPALKQQAPGARNRAGGPQKTELDRIAKKYRKDIDRIFAGLEPQVDRWNQDVQALREKYGKAENNPRARRQNTPRQPAPRLTGWLTPARFLLLEPEA